MRDPMGAYPFYCSSCQSAGWKEPGELGGWGGGTRALLAAQAKGWQGGWPQAAGAGTLSISHSSARQSALTMHVNPSAPPLSPPLPPPFRAGGKGRQGGRPQAAGAVP